MVLRPALSIAAISISLAIVSTHAHAQVVEAETLFNDGDRLMAAGKIAEACDSFEASNRIEARAGTLIRLGECRVKQQRLASAWSAYRDAQTRAKDPKKLQIAKDQVAALEPRLSYMTISVSDEARVEGLVIMRNGKDLDTALWNRAIPIDGGDYVISGRAPGHEEWSTKLNVPVEGGKVTADVPKFKAIAKLYEAPQTGPVTTAPTDRDDGPSMFTPKRKIALVVAGVGLASLATGVFLGNNAKGLQSDAYALCPDPAAPCDNGDAANALMDKARTRALFANIAYGFAGAAAIGATVMWFTGKPERTTRTTTVQITPEYAGVSFIGRF